MGPMCKRIGLTGGIGSGKSTVAAFLTQLGAAVIDADAISRSVTAAGGIGIPAVQREFGYTALTADGAMDRDFMRQLVFTDGQAKRQLERILHPLIGTETERLTQEALARSPTFLVFDIPLLVESTHWRPRLDRVLVIDCRAKTQIQRVTGRSALARDTILAIIAAQAPRHRRWAAADAVVFNDNITLDALHHQVVMVTKYFGL